MTSQGSQKAGPVLRICDGRVGGQVAQSQAVQVQAGARKQPGK